MENEWDATVREQEKIGGGRRQWLAGDGEKLGMVRGKQKIIIIKNKKIKRNERKENKKNQKKSV